MKQKFQPADLKSLSIKSYLAIGILLLAGITWGLLPQIPPQWEALAYWLGGSLMLAALLFHVYLSQQRQLDHIDRQQLHIQDLEQSFDVMAESAFTWEYWVGVDGTLRYVSPSCQQVSSYSRDELLHCPQLLERMIHPDDQPAMENHLSDGSADPETKKFDFRIIDNQGQVRWLCHQCQPVYDSHGQLLGRRVSNRPINKRIAAQQNAEYLTLHDPLTKLPNRTLLFDRLSHAIASHYRKTTRCAVLYIDLYQFKAINLSVGYEKGDQVLIKLARYISQQVRNSDTVSRLGGDEFVVVLQELHSTQEAIMIARNIIRAIQHIELAPSKRCACNIGISVFPDHGDGAEPLITAADRAASIAKDKGENNYHVHQSS